ncbi:uncharacterized protein K02A2.6-like [Anopheles moucheti]|uniref:uncharacterized protein K02A2.6-like n=1 Tax=Anopheles moucheti TaxID=186751 RepID=UPI0022F05627|nr:uncharacterized protein K02A2.6-like [Anopheles moucheti]
MEEDQRRLSQQFDVPGTAHLQPGFGPPFQPNGATLDHQAGSPIQHPPSLITASSSQHPPSLFTASSSQHPPSLPMPSSQTILYQSGEPTMLQLIQLMQQVMTKLEQQQSVSQPQSASQPQQQQQSVSQPQSASQPQQQHHQFPFNPEQILDSLARNITEFRFDADAGVTFEKWYSRYEDLFVRDAARIDDAAKVRLLLRKLGPLEHERYVNYILPQKPRDFTLEATIAKLKSIFGKTESLLTKRYKCMQLVKSKSEDFLVYACRVNRACVDFELNGMSEEQLKCLVFVCGLKEETDKDFRVKLLTRIEERPDITLEQISAECNRIANLKRENAMITGASEERVLALQNGGRNHFKGSDKGSRSHRTFRDNQSGSKKPSNACGLCGGWHWVKDCPKSNYKCKECGESGHREERCRKRKHHTGRRSHRPPRSVRTVRVCSVRASRKFVQVSINGTSIRLQLDTGSDISVIGQTAWEKLGKPSLVKPTVCAKTASNEKLKLLGEFEAGVTICNATKPAIIRVAQVNLLLLGADLVDSFALGSVPMDMFCANISTDTHVPKALHASFPEVFRGTGLCTKAQIKLQLRENCSPVFRPKRPVAYAMQATVEKELDRLVEMNVITPIDYSEWAAPIVVVRKSNGSIRICGDYSTGLNAALQPHEYPLPLPDDIFAKLAHCKIFSKIDLSDAFLQVEIEESCRTLLAINTHRGLYLYNRLPPGLKIAPAAFQQIIDAMLAGLHDTSGYMDDVVVGGRTEREHDENVRKVLQRVQDFGFTIKAEKCAFNMHQIEYLGHIIDRTGLRPNPKKIEAIIKLPAPTNVNEVRSFLGAINYYGKFIPRMRDLRYPLDDLLKNESQFVWTKQCERAFSRFKEVLKSDLLLTYYDPRADIIVAADASSVGLGATISHKFADGSVKVVQHASRALTKAEAGYSQIDREGLAIIFAVTRFHKMLYGRHFRLQTDHRPLLQIFGSKKGIPVYTANRLQRFALTLQLYDFEMEYIPTDKFGNADLLSRLISRCEKPEPEYIIASIELEEVVSCVAIESLKSFPIHFREVATATRNDALLRQVYRYVKEGWPRGVAYAEDLVRFHHRRDALTTVDGCILFGERVVVPAALQKRCLNQLHRGHPGIQRMKAIARSFVYWPSLDNDITDCVATCGPCQAAAKSPQAVAPSLWPKPSGPWHRVHIDYAGPVDGVYFLVVVDAFSKWPEIVKTASITSSATITILRGIFARFGPPITLVSDNGPQFTSEVFSEFCERNGIEHIRTPPFHPQSNGQAERFVDTFKRALRKIQVGSTSLEEALELFLQTYRSTPNPVLAQRTPAEVMIGRATRTVHHLLRPPASSETITRSDIREWQPGDLVYAKLYKANSWSWASGRIVRRMGNVIYEVVTQDQQKHRRHVNQLRRRVAGPAERNERTEHQLPLFILLDEWDLPHPSSHQPALPVPSPASHPTSSSAPPAQVEAQRALASSPTAPAHLEEQQGPPANSRSNTQQTRLPRRSSRIRRLPRRFSPYRLT